GVNIGSASNTPSPLSISGGIGSNASLIVNNTNSGDLLAASSSGTTRFVVNNNGSLQLAGGQAVLSTINSAATSSQTFTLPVAGGTFCIQGSASCGFAFGTNYWQAVNPGTIAPYNTTVDVLVGGTATNSAKFAFTNVAGGTPTASISAVTTQNALSLDALGNIGTTNRQTLTLGGAGTGNITLVSAGTTALTAQGANLTTGGTLTTAGALTA